MWMIIKTWVYKEELQTYQLTEDKERRQIKVVVRYGFVDVVAYALEVAEDQSLEIQSHIKSLEIKRL